MTVRANLEVKARDVDPVTTEQACRELGATAEGVLLQRDTYFSVARGRLKLREHLGSRSAELISYERARRAGVRESRYSRIVVSSPASVLVLMSETFGVSGVISKKRRLYLYGPVRIHLDSIDGLGEFLELEAVLASPGRVSDGERAALNRVFDALCIGERQTYHGSYLDLYLAEKGFPSLEAVS